MTNRAKILTVLSAGAALSLVSLFSFVAPVHAQTPAADAKAQRKAERIADRRAAAKAQRLATDHGTTATPAQIAADQAKAGRIAGERAGDKYQRVQGDIAQGHEVDESTKIAERRADAKAARTDVRTGKDLTPSQVASAQAKAGRIAGERAAKKYQRIHN